MTEPGRGLLRHTVATLAYRGGKVLCGAPAGFAEFQVSEKTRTPGQLLAHIGDLLDWALALSKGAETPSLPWDQGVQRCFTALEALDAYLASDQPLGCSLDKLFQGPIADALSHVGQLAMLRRLAGAPVQAENYFLAGITTGRVGRDQAAPVREIE